MLRLLVFSVPKGLHLPRRAAGGARRRRLEFGEPAWPRTAIGELVRGPLIPAFFCLHRWRRRMLSERCTGAALLREPWSAAALRSWPDVERDWTSVLAAAFRSHSSPVKLSGPAFRCKASQATMACAQACCVRADVARGGPTAAIASWQLRVREPPS